jgi:hypothetical protein
MCMAYGRLGREDTYTNHQFSSYIFLTSHIITYTHTQTHIELARSYQVYSENWCDEKKEEASWLYRCVLFLSSFLSFLLLKASHHLHEWKTKTNIQKKKKKKKNNEEELVTFICNCLSLLSMRLSIYSEIQWPCLHIIVAWIEPQK